jgi:AbrB family looped-hinge helix DNA binding protein
MSMKPSAIGGELRSVGKIGRRRQIVIPKRIMDDLRMREGDFVELEATKGKFVIRRKKVVDPEDTLTAAEATIVRKGEKQLRRGQSRSWADIRG